VRGLREPGRVLKSSYAGLTRVSIYLHKTLAKKMDGRVKPGHDEQWIAVP